VDGLSPAKGFGGSVKSPAPPENSGGLDFLPSCTPTQGNQYVVCSPSSDRGSRPDCDVELLEGDLGSPEKMGVSSKPPEVAEGSSFALEVLVPVNGSPSSVLCAGSALPISVPEVSPIDPIASAKVHRESVDVLTVWDGSGPADSLVPSGLPSSDSLLSHFPSSSSGVRNGMELALMPKDEPVPLSFIDKVRGYSGKKTPWGFLKAVLAYSHWVGITCDGYEGQLLAVFEAIIDSNVKKAAGPSSNLSIKGTRELNRLSCSVNYDAHSGSTSRGRCKGRVVGGFL
jgi:hypothetical protein